VTHLLRSQKFLLKWGSDLSGDFLGSLPMKVGPHQFQLTKAKALVSKGEN
jgi:hypothetical protein